MYGFQAKAFITLSDPTPAVRNFRVVRIGSH